jgi:hypothetical protein
MQANSIKLQHYSCSQQEPAQHSGYAQYHIIRAIQHYALSTFDINTIRQEACVFLAATRQCLSTAASAAHDSAVAASGEKTVLSDS